MNLTSGGLPSGAHLLVYASRILLRVAGILCISQTWHSLAARNLYGLPRFSCFKVLVILAVMLLFTQA